MPMHLGPGPVFVYESIVATRRRQLYALRSLFVLILLAALAIVWVIMRLESDEPIGTVRLRDLAELGQTFYYGISTAQLMLVLIVAPAATAGAICLDRARGNLTHMLVTDLGDAEIVLGKLAARLLPVLALVGATVPVLALAGLLGGIIIEAIVTLTLITLAVAVLGCTLALALSVRATKTHEVLMAVYGIEAAWILGPVVGEILGWRRMPDWYVGSNPFVLAWGPYAWPTYLTVEWLAAVLGGMTALSVGLALYAVLRLRKEVLQGSGSRLGRWTSRAGRAWARLSAWRPAPSLEEDPVLWREWHRNRPSRLARFVWGAYIALALAGTTMGFVDMAGPAVRGWRTIADVNGLQATLGLLLVSLSAPTVLAEERVRGSLDVLMTTPISTDRIVLAKWWGAFRVVPALALLPAIGALVLAMTSEAQPAGPMRAGEPPAPIDVMDRYAMAILPTALLLAQGAAAVSVGLLMATWTRRVGRAVALSVTAYGFIAFIWIVLVEVVSEVLIVLGGSNGRDQQTMQFIGMVLAGACPYGGQILTWQTTYWPASQSRGAFYIGQVILLLVTLAFALSSLALTMATFNRCVGRASERPRKAPRPPRRLVRGRGPHVLVAEVPASGVAG